MNKFYENYRDLFLQQNTSLIGGNGIGKVQNHDKRMNFHNRLQYGRNLFNTNTMGNQFKRLFNPYILNDQSYQRFKTQESPAGKQVHISQKKLKQVILPRLQIYDKQIENKLKRFKTQQKSKLYHSELYQNKNILYTELQKSDYFSQEPKQIFNFNQKRHKISARKKKSNLNFDSYLSQSHFISLLKPAGKPSRKDNENYLQYNPQNEISIFKNHFPKFIDSSFLSGNNGLQRQNQSILETEYQRSYSNKKIRSKKKQNEHIIKTLNTIKYKKPTKNYHFDGIGNNNHKKYSNLQNLRVFSHLKRNQKQSQPFVENDYVRQSQIQENSRSQIVMQKDSQLYQKQQRAMHREKVIQGEQEGLRFSQYENQYAFVSKRLEDIKRFNNYYSHNCINSYKRAIMRRIQSKDKQKERRNKLKIMLLNDQIQYQNELKLN